MLIILQPVNDFSSVRYAVYSSSNLVIASPSSHHCEPKGIFAFLQYFSDVSCIFATSVVRCYKEVAKNDYW